VAGDRSRHWIGLAWSSDQQRSHHRITTVTAIRMAVDTMAATVARVRMAGTTLYCGGWDGGAITTDGDGGTMGSTATRFVADVPELRACPPKSPIRTRTSTWLRIRGAARSSRRSFELVDGLRLLDREPAWAVGPETASRAALNGLGW